MQKQTDSKNAPVVHSKVSFQINWNCMVLKYQSGILNDAKTENSTKKYCLNHLLFISRMTEFMKKLVQTLMT